MCGRVEVPRRVRILTTADGRQPFSEWLAGLRDARGVAIIRKRFLRVVAGNLGDHRSVGDGVMELRIAFGPGYRVYFAEHGTMIVLLLCGGDKSTQAEDIARAKLLWSEWKEQNDG